MLICGCPGFLVIEMLLITFLFLDCIWVLLVLYVGRSCCLHKKGAFPPFRLGRACRCNVTDWSHTDYNLLRIDIGLAWAASNAYPLICVLFCQRFDHAMVTQCLCPSVCQALRWFWNWVGCYSCSPIHIWNSTIGNKGIAQYSSPVYWFCWNVFVILYDIWNVLDSLTKLETDVRSSFYSFSTLFLINSILSTWISSMACEQRKDARSKTSFAKIAWQGRCFRWIWLSLCMIYFLVGKKFDLDTKEVRFSRGSCIDSRCTFWQVWFPYWCYNWLVWIPLSIYILQFVLY